MAGFSVLYMLRRNFVLVTRPGLNSLIDLLTVDWGVTFCVDADSYLVTANSQYGDLDVIADADGFANAAGEYEHCFRSFRYERRPL